MKKLQFRTTIHAPIKEVYETMLGLGNKATYEEWTSAFSDTSTYEGGWGKGSTIRFLSMDDKGQKGGMVSEVAQHIPEKYVSLRHYGLVKGDEEITEGPEVDSWANALENYSFEESNGFTTVIVDVDIVEEFGDYMQEKYPKALDKLKEICER